MGKFSLFGTHDKSTPTVSKMSWIPLADLGQLNEIVTTSETQPALIFKHSSRCGISKMALKQFEKEFDLQEQVTPYFLDLLEHRDISNAVAQRFEILHQSPQLLLIVGGKCVYTVSHSDINAEELHRYVLPR